MSGSPSTSAKYLQTWPEISRMTGAEDPPPAAFALAPKDPLPGHTEGHHPHGKEEQEEEHVDHQLFEGGGQEGRVRTAPGRLDRSAWTTEKGRGAPGPKAASAIRSPIFKHVATITPGSQAPTDGCTCLQSPGHLSSRDSLNETSSGSRRGLTRSAPLPLQLTLS